MGDIVFFLAPKPEFDPFIGMQIKIVAKTILNE